MSNEFSNDLGTFGFGKTLLIDGDILLYRPCCIFNDDSDQDRVKISMLVKKQIHTMLQESECDDYMFFVTGRYNFRDKLVDDYKANRADVERPVNLTWAKRWAVDNLDCHFHKGLEADDLLGIYQDESTVIWSLDKDLRQIPGKHLDDETRKVITISKEGRLEDRGKKVYFEGMLGFYYQCLIGDSTDNIVGCGKRVKAKYASGAKKGQAYTKRKGIGPKAAYKIISNACADGVDILENALEAVKSEYKKVFGDDYLSMLETQANLLWMVRNQDGERIQRWTHDGREEYFDLKEGIIFYDCKTTKDN